VALKRSRHTIAVFRAGVGAPLSRTPAGRFDVTDLVPTGDPSGPFGWFAFGLSGHQPNLPHGWTGGDQLAIHGTNDPASIGTAASAGCLRVSARALAILRQYIRLGTPVVIRS
jgi:lipoprotein-anchoring transpeptidase ErfK/SrfK